MKYKVIGVGDTINWTDGYIYDSREEAIEASKMMQEEHDEARLDEIERGYNCNTHYVFKVFEVNE